MLPSLLLGTWLVAAASAAQSGTADDAREDRWAQEVAPQVVVGDVVWLVTRQRPKVMAIYTEAAGAAKGGAVIVHGAGVHPDWGLIGALRTALPERGFATLSVQMPVLAADAPRDRYRSLDAAAGERIAAAIDALHAKGVTQVAIVAHSIGAAMADAYLARPNARPVAAWVIVGMFVDFAAPPEMPVLDIVAERDFPEALATTKVRAPRLPRDPCSRGIVLPATDHYFAAAGAALADATTTFLADAFSGRCAARK